MAVSKEDTLKLWDELIEAINIIKPKAEGAYPFHCTHETLIVCGVNIDDFTEDEIKRLDDLGFFIGEEWPDTFVSFKYGSA